MGNKRLSGAEALVLVLAVIGTVFVFLGVIGYDAGNRTASRFLLSCPSGTYPA